MPSEMRQVIDLLLRIMDEEVMHPRESEAYQESKKYLEKMGYKFNEQ